MKKYLGLGFLLFSTLAMGKEISCLPNSPFAEFDRVQLVQVKGNKYQAKVFKGQKVLLEDQLSYSFLRRQRIARYRNKKQDIVIKTLKLFNNAVTRSELLVRKINGSSYLGVCKLYPKELVKK